jgi:hypothetical protein
MFKLGDEVGGRSRRKRDAYSVKIVQDNPNSRGLLVGCLGVLLLHVPEQITLTMPATKYEISLPA